MHAFPTVYSERCIQRIEILSTETPLAPVYMLASLSPNRRRHAIIMNHLIPSSPVACVFHSVQQNVLEDI
jgi:hypothetical protein